MSDAELDDFIEEMEQRSVRLLSGRFAPEKDPAELARITFPPVAFTGRVPRLVGPVDFVATAFENASFDDRHPSLAKFVGTSFEQCSFTDARLEGAVFEDARFERCTFDRTGLEATFRRVTFVGCDFEKTRFNDATLEAVRFERCRFDRVFLYRCDLGQVTVTDPTIDGALYGASRSPVFFP